MSTDPYATSLTQETDSTNEQGESDVTTHESEIVNTEDTSSPEASETSETSETSEIQANPDDSLASSWTLSVRGLWLGGGALLTLWALALPLYLWSLEGDNLLHISVQHPKAATPGDLWPLQLRVMSPGSGEGTKKLNIYWSHTRAGNKPIGKVLILAYQPGTPKTTTLRLPVPEVKRHTRELWLQLREQGWRPRHRRFVVKLQHAPNPPLILATLSKPIFQPGEMVRLRLVARSSRTGRAVGGMKGLIVLTPPATKGKRRAHGTQRYPIQLAPTGVGQARFVLPADAILGNYKLTIRFGPSEIKGSFVVSRYTLPAFQVALKAAPWTAPGQPIQVALKTNYLHGAPVEKAQVRIKIEGRGWRRYKEGVTNSTGRFQLSWRPTQKTKRVVITAQVQDRVGRVETSQTIVSLPTLQKKPPGKGKIPAHSFSLVGVEGGVLVPGVPGHITLTTSLQERTKGQLRCGNKAMPILCDAGICHTTLTLAAAQAPLQCQLTLDGGTTASIPLLRWLHAQDTLLWRKAMGHARPAFVSGTNTGRHRSSLLRLLQRRPLRTTRRRKPTPQVDLPPQARKRQLLAYWHSLRWWQGRIHTKQQTYKAGTTLKGHILHRPKHGPTTATTKVYLVQSRKDNVGNAARFHALAVAPLVRKGGQLHFALPIPAKWQGLLQIIAKGPGAAAFVPARVLIQPAARTSISVKADRPLYKPGQQAKLTLQTRLPNGKGVGATLGIEAVDARILALRGADDSFLQWALPFLKQLKPHRPGPSLRKQRTRLQQWLLGDKQANKSQVKRWLSATMAASAAHPRLLVKRQARNLNAATGAWTTLQGKRATLGPFKRADLLSLWWGIPTFLTLLWLLVWGAVVITRMLRSGQEEARWARISEGFTEDTSHPNGATKAESGVAGEESQAQAFGTYPDRVFASVLLISLAAHWALWYIISIQGMQPHTPRLEDLAPRFARLILQPAGLEALTAEQKAWRKRPKPRPLTPAKPPKRPNIRPFRKGIKRYISRKGLLGLIGTPRDSKELAALLGDRAHLLKASMRASTGKASPPKATPTWRSSVDSRRLIVPGRSSRSSGYSVGSGRKPSAPLRKAVRRSILSLIGAKSKKGSASGLRRGSYSQNLSAALRGGGLKGGRSVGSGSRPSRQKGLPGAHRLSYSKGSASPKAFAPARIRQDFPTLLFWKPELVLPASGKGQLRFSVGDAITTWHVRLFGLTTEGFPLRAVKKMRVFQPFFIDFQPPKQLTKGDEVTIPMIITSHVARPLTVKLATIASGKGLQVKLEQTNVQLPPKGIKRVLVQLKALDIGKVRLTLAASAGKEKDALERVLTLTPQGEPVRLSWSGRLVKRTTQTITIPADADLRTLSLKVRVRQLDGALLQSVKALLRRPYGCFEQTSSSTAPNAFALQLLTSQGRGTSPTAHKARQNLARGYRKMLGFQRPSGGFSLYGRGPAQLRLTAYGYSVLREMAKVYPVEKSVLERIEQWLLRQQQSAGDFTQGKRTYGSDLRTTLLVMRALRDTGHKRQIEKANEWARGKLAKSKDAYTLALAVAAVPKAQRLALFERVVQAHTRASKRPSTDRRIYSRTLFGSWGRLRTLEQKAQALQGLSTLTLKSTQSQQLQRWLDDLVEARTHGGAWGTTTLTLAAMRALLEHYKPAPFNPTQVLVHKGAQRLHRVGLVQPGEVDLAKAIRAQIKANAPLTVALAPSPKKKGAALYQIDLAYYPKAPARPKKGVLALQVTPSKFRLQVGERMALQVRIENRGNKAIAAPLVSLGLPPGMVPTAPKGAVKRGQGLVKRQEVRGQRLFLYLGRLKPGQRALLKLPMEARFVARAFSGIHQAFPYYNPKHLTTAPSFRIKIK